MRTKNSADFTNILEIASTSDVTYNTGIFRLSQEPGGFKIKVAVTGTIKVHYLGDAADRIVDLVVTDNDTNVWLADRIDRIVETGTTVETASILIGW